MKSILSIVFTLITFFTFAQVELDYYLPPGVNYDPSIPTPESVIGHQVGEWHITHDRLVNYMRAVAEASPRITLEQIGMTHEARPQLILTITSPANHARIDEIRTQHKQVSDPSASGSLNLDNIPAVLYQGYSIHGNEASGSNAALLAAYHYAAAQGEEIETQLENVVILFDPSFNPDGLTRFSSWVNSRRGKNLSVDPNNQEQNEYWPGGRTNHYWFDLNRDWLTAQQPESKNRIRKFHEWKPNVLTDHHEMGSNSSFFFQPGIPSRNNPNTPQNNYVITEKIGTYHAKALDRIGSLYYSKEDYDDFFYGKGSTFPDINGGIGILFEQASARGHARETDNGILTFPFAVRNQFVTSLSTLEAVSALKGDLLNHQRTFFQEAQREASANSNQGVVFGSGMDESRSRELAKILDRHEIEVYKLGSDASVNGTRFPSQSSYYVPFNQDQYRLIDIMFETVTSFEDSLFYDVSTWVLPMAFDCDYEYVSGRVSINRGDRFSMDDEMTTESVSSSDYAYAFTWEDYYAPSLLWKLTSKGIICKVTEKAFSHEGKEFKPGSVIIPVAMQDQDPASLNDIVSAASMKSGVKIYSIPTGSTQGIYLGSRSFATVEKPSIAVLVEEGVRSYDAGEIWHLLDNRFDMAVTLLPIRELRGADLNRYTTLVMANGYYGSLSSSEAGKIKDWVQGGGTLIAFKGANNWLNQNEITNIKYVESEQVDGDYNYDQLSDAFGAQATGGSIFRADLDITNPIGWGYDQTTLDVFVNSNTFFQVPDNKYASPLTFTSSPLSSGYVSEENLERIKNTSAIIVSRSGSGRVVSFSFNPNFRAFWYGTNKLFFNAIYFGGMVQSRAAD